VKGPQVEATLFAPSKSILADLPVLKLVPKETQVVFAVRDPATIVAKLGTLGGFAEAKDPIAKEIDDAAKEISKDLPEIAALAANGVDLAKPAGVMWTDHELDTAVIFAAVSDEAAMKKWLEERAKQSNGRRELITSGDALILRAKRDVTRAVVLRKGVVFWVRTRESFGLDPKRVTSAADAIAQTAEAGSLGADPTFTKAVASLAHGAEASLFVNAGRFAEGIVAARTKALADAQKGLDEAKAKLADAEKKKRKERRRGREVRGRQRAARRERGRAAREAGRGARRDEGRGPGDRDGRRARRSRRAAEGVRRDAEAGRREALRAARGAVRRVRRRGRGAERGAVRYRSALARLRAGAPRGDLGHAERPAHRAREIAALRARRRHEGDGRALRRRGERREPRSSAGAARQRRRGAPPTRARARRGRATPRGTPSCGACRTPRRRAR
jgi:hypothetical protein